MSLSELILAKRTFRTASEIFRHIKQSTKKTLINKISARLLELELKSDNIIKSKAIYIFFFCLIISKNRNVFR